MDLYARNEPAEGGSSPSIPPAPLLPSQEQSQENKDINVDHFAVGRISPQNVGDGMPSIGSSFSAVRPSYAGDPEPLRNLIVNYLPPLMDELQLHNLFMQFGPIESVKIIYDKETKESRGYGFVKYAHFFSASYAMNALNGYFIAGKRLKVAYANVEAAWEAYRVLRASATMFSMTQQSALQAVFYQQMMLAQQEERGHYQQ